MYIVINTKDTPLSEIKQELIEHLKILIQDKKNFSNKQRPLNIPCQVNSDRRNPITPELKF